MAGSTPAASPKTFPQSIRPFRSPTRDHGCCVLDTSRSVPNRTLPPCGGTGQPCLPVTILKVGSSWRGQLANRLEERFGNNTDTFPSGRSLRFFLPQSESTSTSLYIADVGLLFTRDFYPILMGECTGSIAKHARGDMTTDDVTTTTAGLSDRVERIAAHQLKFLGFLSARVEDRAAAEDILQSAYLKAVEHGSDIRDDESTVAWFYRILRNAITDHYRRRAAQSRAHESFAADAPVSYEVELTQTACACIGDLIRDLKSEYRTAIEQVDLGGATVEAFARSQQTSANNASVRLHRARKAVAKKLTTVCGACAEHKCLDCTCRRSQL